MLMMVHRQMYVIAWMVKSAHDLDFALCTLQRKAAGPPTGIVLMALPPFPICLSFVYSFGIN
jgi:hypothetical protein